MPSARALRRRELIYELLLSLCLLVLVSFAFPQLSWLGTIGYSLIALLLTQLVMIRKPRLSRWDRLYRLLGVIALAAQWIWVITPLRMVNTGVPLVLSWSLLVGWSVVRLVDRLSQEKRVTAGMLMGAAAGYLLLGLTSGLVMSAVETIQPGSFEPLDLPTDSSLGGDLSVLMTPGIFAKINYFAFVCLTTVGFGDINPMLPLSRMLSVTTSIAGPLYLAVVMGVLISRYTGDVEERDESSENDLSDL
ncbi:MAG: two pore domain potassium channel family protein [Synechococcaceae bacterium WB9_4xC_028]|jgi:voltage-gated potassium channel|uniref:potassium channel family protein n=1 Tax=Synechococcus sp. BS56D TaxID=2055944 RepID=UPI00103E9592|nr:potassium channel family protein [Synechococcus sp. BS56D]NDD68564.1 two pore domain potassium channel family protein [Synechococcaceae bacterium WB9_4xC_028]TCD56734.1 potassium channel protein [Synechococcus sp. BS56D]